jgi:hypothetical protein
MFSFGKNHKDYIIPSTPIAKVQGYNFGIIGIRETKIKGHTYLITDQGGITHAAHCPCRNKQTIYHEKYK